LIIDLNTLLSIHAFVPFKYPAMETDVAVAVMGMTGVGKSTFIKMITGDEEISIGHGLVSGILLLY
jgi:ABC-type thiamine transport system ATPase subunit